MYALFSCTEYQEVNCIKNCKYKRFWFSKIWFDLINRLILFFINIQLIKSDNKGIYNFIKRIYFKYMLIVLKNF